MFFGINCFAQHLSKRKVYIYSFKYNSNELEYEFFKRALPQSIKSTIGQSLYAKRGNKRRSRKALRKEGYNFYIEGQYKVTKKEIFVTFSVIYLKTNSAVLVAFAHGSKKGAKIFSMIDGVSKLIVTSLNKRIADVTKKTIILSVDEHGNITKSTESLANLDLSGGNFTGVDFSNRNMEGTNLSNANLTNAKLVNVNLKNANLRGATLRNTDFTAADVAHSDFSQAKGISIYNNLVKSRNKYKAKYDANILNLIRTPSYYAGFYIGPGLTYSIHNVITGGQTYSSFAGQIAGRFIFKTGYFSGVFVDLGYHILRSKEKDSLGSLSVKHDLHYLFLNMGPCFIYRNIIFNFGLSINYLLKVKEQIGSLSESSTDGYNKINLGAVFGFRYKFYYYNKIDMLAGIDVKLQLDNFSKNRISEKKMFGIFLNFEILFTL